MGLLLCAKCERHVRSIDEACPFCGSSARLAPTKAKPRASRSAMIGAAAIAMSAASGAGLVSCSSTSPGDDGGTTDAAYEGMIAAYGGPPDGSLKQDSSTNDASQPDAPVAAYGGPPQDAGGG